MVNKGTILLTGKPSSIQDNDNKYLSTYWFKGFFQGKKDKGKQEKTECVGIDAKPVEQPAPSVRFIQLFRYATPFELSLNAVGIVSAIAAGAAQA